MAPSKILVTGASGYIGGSVLSQLVGSKYERIAQCEISGLVRGEGKAKVLEQNGIKPQLHDSLDNTEELKEIARNYDIIVGCALGYHEPSAKAFVEGLGLRKRETGEETYFIHTSGTSNLGDQPVTGAYREDRVFSDMDDDIYAYEKKRNERQPYAQRTTELSTIETGISYAMKTYIIMSPTIYGLGSGLFNRLTIQSPTMIRTAIKEKQALVISDGKGVWNHVHIEDLAALYEIFVAKIVAGDDKDLIAGERGIYFSETGNHTWRDIAEGLGYALRVSGVTETEQARSLSVEEAAVMWASGDQQMAEVSFASKYVSQ
ncbi:MAG: hypothetical protein Q9201_002914 [Fulgogasparrea decipioides]